MPKGNASTREIWTADNLEVLASLESGSVSLVYLDPPFNSGRSFEAVLGRSAKDAGRKAFDDNWHWDSSAEAALRSLDSVVTREAADLVRAVVGSVGRCDLAAYLVMMAPRLKELHRVLAENGSLYLHCDPAASHYLKMLLDSVFGAKNFRNELVWKRTHAHSSSRRFGPVHDVILFYSKDVRYTWNHGYVPYSADYIKKYFRKEDSRGRYQLITCSAPGSRVGTRAHYNWRGVWPPPNRHWAWTEERMEQLDREGLLVHSVNGVPRLKEYCDEGKGVRIQDVWNDISPLGAHSEERTGFETQKPIALLERIIAASSDPGSLILDPFGGSGTTAIAAESLGRSWIVCDSSLLGASLTLSRLRAAGCSERIRLHGFPSTPAGALKVLSDDQTTFAVWGTGMLGTLLDDSAASPRLATGFGTRKRDKQTRSVGSWVPLTRSARIVPAASSRQFDDAHLLITGRTALALLNPLAEQSGGVVVPVKIEECVSPRSQLHGTAIGAGS